MAIDNSDFLNSLNQLKLNNSSLLFGKMADTNIGGLSADTIQQWNMRGTNATAYRRLLAAEAAGSIRNNETDYTLASEKYYKDDYIRDENGKITGTYTPAPTTAADAEIPTQLEALRNLALAAGSNPDSINNTYFDIYKQILQNVSSALITTPAKEEAAGVEDTPAGAAVLKGTADFRYLDEAERFTIAGKAGEETYSFAAGTSLDEIAQTINDDSAATGVSATILYDASGQAVNISLASAEVGEEAFLRVDQLAGGLFGNIGASVSAKGTAAVAGTPETVARGGDYQAALATGVYGGVLSQDQEFTLAGVNGSRKFSFAAGTSVEDMAAEINAASASLGVKAEVIRNAQGAVEGLGLESLAPGERQFVNVKQERGYLFTAPGKNINVYGKSENPGESDRVNSLAQLGKTSIGGETYSFDDLLSGRLNIYDNPTAVLAVVDRAIAQAYSGEAVLNGFDPADAQLTHPYVTGNQVAGITGGSNTPTALGLNDFGSTAIADWVAARLAPEED